MKVESMAQVPLAVEEKAVPDRNLLTELREMTRTKEFALIAGTFGALLFAFWPLLKILGRYWLDFDGYYAHGLLMPFAAAYIIWARWPSIKDTPVRACWPAVLLFAPSLYVMAIASRTEMPFLMSVIFIFSLLSAVWFVAGFRWLMNLAPAILFLALGLPIFDRVIDTATFKLQLISTDTAELMLKLIGFNVLRVEPTVIHLDNFNLNIAEACSGLKTTIAVSASVLFFMLTTKLKWWAAALLALIAIPLSVLVNGLRISLIGVVGNTNGADAGMKFHDYSGYIALAVCFLALAKLTKLLEAKE